MFSRSSSQRCRLSRLPHRLCRNATTQASNTTVNAIVTSDHSWPYPSSSTGPLAGMSIAVKDNICTKYFPTTCSSRMLKQFNSPLDATVVSLLSRSGAGVIGKANCDEFGMG